MSGVERPFDPYVDGLEQLCDEMRAQVQAVRELHRDMWQGISEPDAYGELWPVPTCDECRERYPCDTVRTLDGAG